MNRKLIAALALALAAAPLQAQSGAELLQKAIFAQETEGNLDNAISVYRQIVGGGYTRDVAAQAQYRLAQALLQKGDLTNAATEFQRLARDYSDYRNLVSSMAGQARHAVTPGGIRTNTDAERVRIIAETEMQKMVDAGKASMTAIMGANFDASKSSIEITGYVAQVTFSNPLSSIRIETQNPYSKSPAGEMYVFGTMAPNTLIRQGFTRDSLKLGQKVTVSGVLADDGRRLPEGDVIGKANIIRGENGAVIWDRNAPLGAQIK